VRTLSYTSVLATNASQSPYRPAVSDATGTTNYAQLARVSGEVARVLAAGLSPGSRVGIAMIPCAAYLAIVHACLTAGLKACPLNTRLAPAEAEVYMSRVEPEIVVSDVVHHDWARKAGVDPVTLEDGSVDDGMIHSFRSRLTPRVAPPAESHVSRSAILFGTGGTTGVPKAAVYTDKELLATMFAYALDGKRSGGTHEINCAPFFHVSLMAPLATLFMGGHVEILPRFDPDAVLDGIRRGVTTVGGAAPAVWDALRRQPGFDRTDRSNLRLIAYGTAPSSAEFAARLLADYPNAEVLSGFGSTETGYVSYARRSDLEAGRLAGVGRPLPGVTVTVVDPDGVEVPRGEVGELAVSTPWGAREYWGMPEETASTWTEHGVMLGDLGRVDPDGWISIVGRLKDIIITGGENVYPAEVESVFATHPGIQEVAVYGVADPHWGERVEAAIVPAPGCEVDLDALREWGRSRLAAYKLPKGVRVMTEIPRTALLKIDRNALQAEARTV
jgi:fatty-acyl-CoA synthase